MEGTTLTSSSASAWLHQHRTSRVFHTSTSAAAVGWLVAHKVSDTIHKVKATITHTQLSQYRSATDGLEEFERDGRKPAFVPDRTNLRKCGTMLARTSSPTRAGVL